MTSGRIAAAAGRITIGGDLSVNRMGFGAMRITGKGIWGPPADLDEAKRVLRRAVELGIDFIDTAESYGPAVSEQLIAEVLSPYPDGLVVATKGGLTRPGPDVWRTDCRPEALRRGVHDSLRRLKLERIDLWQLHRVDKKVPQDEQFDAVAELRREGLIRHVGLSEVSVEQIEAAERYFPVVSVQNLYNLSDRGHEAVVEHCAKRGIAFIPWYPLAAGDLAAEGGVLDGIAKKLGATPSQIALAWVLKRSPVMLPIPGTGKVRHLEENTAAAGVALPDEDYAALEAAAGGA